MQRCSHCSAQQMDGAIFCSECGASLLTTGRHSETTTSLNRAADPSTPLVAESEPLEEPLPVGSGICLVVLGNGRRIDLGVGDKLLVGRKDNQRGIYPDIDLGLDGGYDAGVSRRHAVIAIQGPMVTVEDLGSANGTFVNGQRLQPEDPTAINHGDELKFGTLSLRFEIA